MRTIKIGIIDDQNLFVRAIKRLLDNFREVKVVSTAETGEELLNKLKDLAFPDVVIIGINRITQYEPGSLKRLITSFSNCKTIALSSLTENKDISEIILCGVQGYVSKSAEPDELIEAIKTVFMGGLPFNDQCLRILRNQYWQKEISQEIKTNFLFTPKELEIIKLICKENTNSEISDVLNISKKTVETHKRHILSKIGVKNAVGIAVYATRHNLTN